MNEQQRFLLSLFCCLSIWFGWQYYTGGLEPPPPATVAATNTGDAARGALPTEPSSAERAGAAAPASADAARPVRPSPAARQSFATKALRGEVQDVDAALTALSLPSFAPRVLEEDADESAVGIGLMPERTGRAASVDQAGLRVQVDGRPVVLRFVAGETLVLTGETEDSTRVQLRLSPDPERYAVGYTLDVDNRSATPKIVTADFTLALAPVKSLEANGAEAGATDEPGKKDERPFAGLRSLFGGGSTGGTERLSGLFAEGDKLTRKDFATAAKKGFASAQPVDWAAVDEQYFLLAWVPTDGQRARASLFTRESTLGLNVNYEASTVAAGASLQRTFQLFAGPKRDSELAAVDARLKESIDYTTLGIPLGFLARPMVALLRTFHAATHSWGASIMLLTLVVKLLLLPVVYKSVTSMRRIQEVKPEIDALKVRYASDPERFQAEQMRLFKERGVNPVAGCLPALAQAPVWITLYRTLWGAVDLYRQPFLWLHDLTAREPFPFLALAVGAATYVQQKVTPVAMDPQQARVMMVMMPVIITLCIKNMPSGLVLYILANAVLTIVQQLVIHRRAATPTKA